MVNTESKQHLFLVTGGAGFIGSNLVEELVNKGQQVRVMDNFSTGKRENLLPFLDRIELVEGDIRSYHIVRKAVEGVDFILHQAALPSVPRSIIDPITTNEVNVVGTLNILNAALEANVRRIIFASSSSVYGNSEVLPKIEDMIPNPMSPYAVSKLAGEKYCQVYTQLYGLETVILRYFNVFGPKQNLNSEYAAVIPKFIRLMKDGNPPTIYGDGEQCRDFTYVYNVVSANLLACTVDTKRVNGEIFNVAFGEKISINKLVEEINTILGKSILPIYTESRLGDVKHSLGNITKARQYFGYNPKVEFLKGLEITIEGI